MAAPIHSLDPKRFGRCPIQEHKNCPRRINRLQISTSGTSLPKLEDLSSYCIALCIRQSLEVVLNFAAVRRSGQVQECTNNRCGSVCRRDEGSSFLSHFLLYGCSKQGCLGNYADIESPCIYLMYIPLSGTLSAALCSVCPYRIIDLLRRSGLEGAEHNQHLS